METMLTFPLFSLSPCPLRSGWIRSSLSTDYRPVLPNHPTSRLGTDSPHSIKPNRLFVRQSCSPTASCDTTPRTCPTIHPHAQLEPNPLFHALALPHLTVIPRNYLLFACHATNATAQLVQCGRWAQYWKFGGREQAKGIAAKVSRSISSRGLRRADRRFRDLARRQRWA